MVKKNERSRKGAKGPQKRGAPTYSKKEANKKHKDAFSANKKRFGKEAPSNRNAAATARRPTRQSPSHASSATSRRGGDDSTQQPGRQPRQRAPDIDINAAAKVTADLRADISRFKERRGNVDVFGPSLNELFALVPPTFVNQHLPEDVAPFKSYLTKFSRGSANVVDSFTKWYEWASLELNRGKRSRKTNKRGDGSDDDDDDDNDSERGGAGAKTDAARERKGAQKVLAKTLKDREHVRALLQMCLRFNYSKRKEGQRALVNYMQANLSEEGVSAVSLDDVRATAHPSVAYGCTRLLLGMAADNIASIVLNCQALFLVLSQTNLGPRVVLDIISEELALPSRMQVVKQRLQRQGVDDVENTVDPDDVNDPTKGERNQKMSAAVFALCALIAANPALATTPGNIAQTVVQFLAFCYVEQKATRVLSANLLLKLLRANPSLLDDEETLQWISFAFFHFPKMEYYRPEGIQVLLFFMELRREVPLDAFPEQFHVYRSLDPLEPSTLEQIANALFRNEQVTAVHPMVHPVWNDIFNIVLRRCAAGESMKNHLSTIAHTVIAPYRRGSADVPRRALFQNLVARLGQIAVGADDAQSRAEMLHLASTNLGYGERTKAKPTPFAELRNLPSSALNSKVEDLIVQYRQTRDKDLASTTNRNWILQELKGCLSVPVHSSVETHYVESAAAMLFEYGFFPPRHATQESTMNRCVYMFADVFSFTFEADVARPKCHAEGLALISRYLKAEEQQLTRYNTAVQHSTFRKARNKIVEALEKKNERSVLFYNFRDMEILLTLLFLILSTDDATNSEARVLASQTTTDLVLFFLTGTLETIEMFVDVLMSLIMRTSAPLQVMPLMTCVRRIAKGYLLRFARHFTSKETLNLILSPLREAYATDSREIARQLKGKDSDDDEENEENEERGEGEEVGNNDGDTNNSEDDDDDVGSASSSTSASNNGSDNEESDADTDADTDVAEEDNHVEEDEEDAEAEEGEEEWANTGAADAETESEGDDVDDDEDADQPVTEEYISTLKRMVGDIDLDHKYPQDVESKERSDIIRAIQLCARTGLQMRTPLVLDIFQVLLAVCRENVKASDDTVFNSALSSVEMLLLSKERYYGYFCEPADLFQLLGDIQSYCRKLETSLIKSEKSPKAAAAIRRRFAKLKLLSLRTLHYVCMLAHKNHAREDIRVTLCTYYASIFCDRGWDMKKVLPSLKRDLYHYRHGFAWAVLPAAFEKYAEVAALPGAQRYKTFAGCCLLIEAMLPRLSGLKADLKAECGRQIAAFLQSVTLYEVFEIKHTLPFNYLHCVKMVLQYNSRVNLSTTWAAQLVDTAVSDDGLQLSSASIRVLASMERLLGLTPRARETKNPVPVKLLFQQFAKHGAAEKSDFYRRSKVIRGKILKSVLAYRNGETSDAERAARRRRREELRVEDRVQRQVMRENTSKTLSKAEREERRKRILLAKQERIAKNRERKRRLFEARKKAFEQWRSQKLFEARHMDDDRDDDAGDE